MFESGSHGDVVAIVLALAALTYLTRIGGHLILSRFSAIHPRLEAGLEAVPMAVIATLVVPPAFTHGLAEALAIAIVCIAALRLNTISVVLLGLAALVGARSFGL